jgi:dUTP pyrophosphatase
MSAITVHVTRLAHGEGLPLPERQSRHAAGWDLCAAVEAPTILPPGRRVLIPTGLAIALPAGYEGQLRPRSGLAAKHGVTVLNAPGTVDADYRGEVKVLLINHGTEPFVVTRGMRIAQLVVASVASVALVEIETREETARGNGGFGSTALSE